MPISYSCLKTGASIGTPYGDSLREIFLVLYRAPCRAWLSVFSRTRYNHLAISLDPALRNIYGFVGHGGGRVLKSDIKSYPDGDCMILKKQVKDEQYQKLKERLEKAWNEKTSYRYHHLGVIVLAFVLAPLYRAFRITLPQPLIRKIFNHPKKRMCVSFVGIELEQAGIPLSPSFISQRSRAFNPYSLACFTFRKPKLVGFDVVYVGRVQGLDGKQEKIAESGVVVCTQ